MPARHRPPGLRQRGQAAVELVALLPLVIVGLAGCWQAVLAAHAGWSASGAARSAARAHAIGTAELPAARAALPESLDHRVRVEAPDGDGPVTVHISIPTIVPGLRLGAVTAHATFARQR